ncbi:MAG: chloride channel protein [Bacteriovoracaceae bacterium]|nr:chloride channel protein [Bacteriovoracaceae bacterium]
MPEAQVSRYYVLKWIYFATVASIYGTALTYFLRYLIINAYGLIASRGIPLYFFPIVGALLCGLIIYKIRPQSAGEGVPRYMNAVNSKTGNMTISTSICKFLAVTVTLACGGSGGLVGPLIRVNSGFMFGMGNFLEKFGFNKDDRRTMTICGASAICAIVFQAPVSAGLFAVEVLKRANMRYLDLFPAIMTSCLSVALVRFLNYETIYPFHVLAKPFPLTDLLWILLIGTVTGYYSLGYITFYGWVRNMMGRDKLKLRNMILGAVIITGMAFFVHEGLIGTSSSYFKNLTTGEGLWPWQGQLQGRFLFITFFILAILKGVTNCVTVGSGLSAGFTGPSMIMGLFIGAAFAQLLGVAATSGTYYAFLAAGMSGVLSASMNIPLAASMMGAEIMGPAYVLPSTISSIVAFQIARRATIYDQKFSIGTHEED